MVQWNRT